MVSPSSSGARERAWNPPGENQIGPPSDDIGGGRIDGLQARSAIAHDRPARRPGSATQAQGHQAADIGLVRRGGGAAQDHFIEVGGQEGLSQQQRPPRLDGEVRSGKGPRPAPGLEEGRAGTIDQIDGAG